MKPAEFDRTKVTPLGDDFVTLISNPDAAVRLVCFHFAGGSAQSFLPWRDEFQGGCELIAAELPGRTRRYNESFYPSIAVAVEKLAQSYLKLPRKRTIFYGHSLGALLAYETTRLLSDHDCAPEHLILSSRSGPVNFPVSIGLPELSDDSLLTYLKNLEGTTEAVLENKTLMKVMLPIIRSDLEIIYGYQHDDSTKVTIPVEVIGAIDDQHCPFESLMDWKNITDNSFRLHMIPGGHFSPINTPDIVKQKINQLSVS